MLVFRADSKPWTSKFSFLTLWLVFPNEVPGDMHVVTLVTRTAVKRDYVEERLRGPPSQTFPQANGGNSGLSISSPSSESVKYPSEEISSVHELMVISSKTDTAQDKR